MPSSRCALVCLLAVILSAPAQTGYQEAPKEVRDILYAPMGPTALFSPARDRALLVENDRYPPLADLAQPYLSLAGRRIDPRTHGPHQEPRLRSLSVLDLESGDTKPVALPKDGRPARVVWS